MAELTPTAHVDFESFSEVKLKATGSCRYAEHPSTEILCMAYAIDDESPSVWTPGVPAPRRLFDHIAVGGLVHAWNAEFEIPIWSEVCADRMCWPSVPADQWRDTAAVALSLALPAALDDCGAALGLEIQKDQRGKHLVNKLCKPRRPSKHNPATRWTPESVPQDFADLYSYCARDVEAERAIYRALPRKELPRRELETWRLTVEMNLRGWRIDADSVRRMLEVLEEYRRRAHAELEELTDGEVRTENQIDKSLDWLCRHGVDLPDYQAATIAVVLREDAVVTRPRDAAHPLGWTAPHVTCLPPKCRRVLEIRQDLSKTSTRKLDAMMARLCDDGTVKNNVMYHGAGTGRDVGRGMQIHNFPKKTVSSTEEGIELAIRTLHLERPLEAIEIMYGKTPHFASAMLRPMLVSASGRDLVSADFSSIDNRVSVWYADCAYGIDIFKRGIDEYKQFATRFYGVKYEAVTGAQRDHSKQGVLGCCYGLGWYGLQMQAARFGQHIDDEGAKELVNVYRELYSEVVDMWHALTRCAMHTVNTGERTSTNKVTFTRDADFLFMKLASGRKLAYYDPKVEDVPMPWGGTKPGVTHMGMDSQVHVWCRMSISPGRYFACAVQGTARDLMMHGAKATTCAGYDAVGRVHDEIISEVDEGVGSVEEYCDLMTDVPQWMDGILIVAKGWRSKRYRK